jgi:hypothetical protein
MRGMDWILDLLTADTHYSELQIMTVLSVISTTYSSLLQTLVSSAYYSGHFVSWQRTLTQEL